jgi:hypothetical protein
MGNVVVEGVIPGTEIRFRARSGGFPVSIKYSGGLGGLDGPYGIIDDEDYSPKALRAIADHMEQWIAAQQPQHGGEG